MSNMGGACIRHGLGMRQAWVGHVSGMGLRDVFRVISRAPALVSAVSVSALCSLPFGARSRWSIVFCINSRSAGHRPDLCMHAHAWRCVAASALAALCER